MAYEKLELKDGQVLKAEHMDHIEEGISTAHEDIYNLQETKANNDAIPSKTSQLTNDSGFLTEKPTYTASEVGADASGTAQTKVSEHNISETSHYDIRLLIDGLTTRLNTLANSDDTTLDQMAELVAYIKNNKTLIDGITTNKVSVTDIVDDLETNVWNKPLSAKQGAILKGLIDAIVVPTLLSQLSGDSTHRTVTDAQISDWNAKSNFSGAFKDLTGKPTTLSGYGITDGATKEQVGQLEETIDDHKGDTTSHVSSAEKQAWNNKSDFSGKYEDLSGKPTIPSKTSQLANDSNFVTKTVTDQLANEIAGLQQIEKPKIVSSIAEMTDTTKHYVLNGYIYQSREVQIEGGTVANFTNQLPISKDASGNKYNGKGWKEDTYLSSGNEGTRAGVNLTGFIPIGNIVYLKNVEALTTNSNVRISFYDSTKTTQGTRSATQWTSSPVINAEKDSNGYVTKLDLATARSFYKTNSGGNDVAFFRFCAPGIDDDSIITVDQEITYTTTEGGTKIEWVNTGLAYNPADYENRIIELETNVATLENRIDELKKTESTSGEIVPVAVIDSASTLVDKALSRADGNVLRFTIYSDAHQNNDNELITKGNKELGQAIGEVVKQIGVDFVSSIGDGAWASYANTKENVREQLKQLNRFINPYIKGEQILNCEGNHDDANYSTVDNDGDGIVSSTEKLSLAETYSLIYAKNKDVVYDADHYIDGYCYKDFEHLKTRVICLNTEQGTADGGVVEGYQLKWFAETALNMTGKMDWNVITLAHHPLDYPSNTLFKDCVNIVDAFINGSNFSYTTTNGTAISIDYSGKNCQYVGHFHGHAHAFSVVKMQKYVNSSYVDINAYEICIPNACYSRNNQYLGNTSARIARYCTETTYNKSDVDGQRTSFNLVTIDLDNKIIYADNYGAGFDREVSYAF